MAVTRTETSDVDWSSGTLNEVVVDNNNLILATSATPSLYYDYGTEYYSWITGDTREAGSQSKESDHLYMSLVAKTGASARAWETSVKVDLSDIATLKLARERSANHHVTRFGISNNRGGDEWDFVARVDVGAGAGTDSLDVSSYSTSYYIKIHLYDGSLAGPWLKSYKVWGEDASGNILIYISSGIRISPALNISPISSALASVIEWDVTNTDNTTLTIHALVNTSSATAPAVDDEDWESQTSSAALTVISTGIDYNGKYLWLKQTEGTTDTDETPQLHSLYVQITNKTNKNLVANLSVLGNVIKKFFKEINVFIINIGTLRKVRVSFREIIANINITSNISIANIWFKSLGTLIFMTGLMTKKLILSKVLIVTINLISTISKKFIKIITAVVNTTSIFNTVYTILIKLGGHLRVKPEMMIKKRNDGNLSITNSATTGVLQFTGISADEEIYIDNNREIIVSDLEQNRYNAFEGEFLELEVGKNTLSIEGASNVKLRWREKFNR